MLIWKQSLLTLVTGLQHNTEVPQSPFNYFERYLLFFIIIIVYETH